jgi:cytochrome c556
MNEDKKNTLWEFSFRALKLDIFSKAKYEDDTTDKIKGIINEMISYEEYYAKSFHGSHPDSVRFLPEIEKKLKIATNTLGRKRNLIEILKEEIKVMIQMLEVIKNSAQRDENSFVKNIIYLKKLQSIYVELLMPDNEHNSRFPIISRISSVISHKNEEIKAQVDQYALILGDFNFLENLILSFDVVKESYEKADHADLDLKLFQIKKSKNRLENSLDKIKNELVNILNSEIKTVSNVVKNDEKFINFKEYMRKIKINKMLLIREEKTFNQAMEDLKNILREMNLIRIMIVRLSPYELFKFSNQIAALEKISKMYPEDYSYSLLQTESYNHILKTLFEENKKSKKYHEEYITKAKKAQNNIEKLIEKETQLDVYFAKIWSDIQRNDREGKE